MSRLTVLRSALDCRQQCHRPVGFVLAVLRKYSDVAAHVTLLAAEANVVAARLWPRSLAATDRHTTEADRRALTALTRAERRRAGQTIEVELAGASGRARERRAA